VHASLFADVGNAWTGAFRRADAKASFGGEISADVVVGYGWRLTFTTGVAETRQHGIRASVVYGRLGRAF
jgi:hypothetical protein